MESLEALLRWAQSAPRGTTIPAEALVDLLQELEMESPPTVEVVEATPRHDSWRSRIWTVPEDTRLGVEDVAEAIGRSKHAVYRAASSTRRVATGNKDKEGKPKYRTTQNLDPLPSRKVGGQLSFRAGDVRAWLERQEDEQSGPELSVQDGGSR
jgi:hypothetical protein